MTFDEANEMRGNPHFKEDKSFQINCQTCVVANEMRRRGYNVEALAYKRRSVAAESAEQPELAWLDADGKAPKPNRSGITPEVRHYDAIRKVELRNRKKAVCDEVHFPTFQGSIGIPNLASGQLNLTLQNAAKSNSIVSLNRKSPWPVPHIQGGCGTLLPHTAKDFAKLYFCDQMIRRRLLELKKNRTRGRLSRR